MLTVSLRACWPATFLVLWTLNAASCFAFDTRWSMTLDTVANTFSATETVNSVTLSGTLAYPSTGFIQHTVSTSTGAVAPTNGTVFYSLSLPGITLLSQPIETTEREMIYMETSGSCPSGDFGANFIFTHWDPNGNNLLTSDYQPVFGIFNWVNSTTTGTVSTIYNMTRASAITNFTPFSISGSCSAGVVDLTSGGGDRGGSLYVTDNANAFFRTNSGKGVFVVPETKIYDQTEFYGTYAGFVAVNGQPGVSGFQGISGASQISTYRFSIATDGATVSGTAVDAGTGSATGPTVSINLSSVNNPTAGFIRGSGTQAGIGPMQMSCAWYANLRSAIYCVMQDPADTDNPVNIMMVGDNANYSRPATGSASSFNGSVLTMAPAVDNVNLGRVYAAGSFSQYNGNTNSGRFIVRLNPNGTPDWTFQTLYSDGSGTGTTLGFNSTIETVLPAVDPGNLGKVYVGGDYTRFYGLTAARYLVRLGIDGHRDTSFATPQGSSPSFDNSVYSIVAPIVGDPDRAAGKIYVGGAFDTYGGTAYPAIMRIQSDGTPDPGFVIDGSGPGGDVIVYALAPAAETGRVGQLYVGGDFAAWNGNASCNGIVRLLSNGALDTTFQLTQIDATIHAVAPATDPGQLGKVYIGGDFGSINGTAVTQVARLNSDGSLDTSFNLPGSGLSSTLGAIVQSIYVPPTTDPQTTKIYIGGEFDALNGTSSTKMMRLLSDGTMDTTFFSGGLLYNGGQVNAIVPGVSSANADTLFVGGAFTSYKGTGRGRTNHIDFSSGEF